MNSKKTILLLLFFFLGYVKSIAFGEVRTVYLGEVKTDLTVILNFSLNQKKEYILYGLNKENQLIKQFISLNEKDTVNNKKSIILYSFEKSIKPAHIAVSNNKIAYIKNSKVYEIDLKPNSFNVKTYHDKTLRNSELLLLKIIDNSVQVFCKKGTNNYFIYKVFEKKNKRVKFNFSPGTVINNFKVEANNYLISGYIKDPILNDQYAYFSKTDLTGKMIWEKEEGQSDKKSVGFDMDKSMKLLFSINGKVKANGSKILSKINDARIINTEQERNFIFKEDDKIHFFREHKNLTVKAILNELEIKNDSILKKEVSLIQSKTHPFLFKTTKRYSKGANFQCDIFNNEKYSFHIVSFSGNGKVDKFHPKTKGKKTFTMPSEKTMFEKLDNKDEYLLLLYSREKTSFTSFINANKWNSETIKNLCLYLFFKTEELKYTYSNNTNFKSIYVNNILKQNSIIPILIKVKGVGSIKNNNLNK